MSDSGFALPIVDAHLDLAYNAIAGRDLRLAAARVRELEQRDDQQCMVTFPELKRGGVALVVGSVFVSPGEVRTTTDFEFNPKKQETAKAQVAIYQAWEDEGLVRLIRTRSGLDEHLQKWDADKLTGLLINMESAEPIREPAELPWWFDNGVRMIGPAWGSTRYCGGFAGKDGLAAGFTPLGRDLLAGMKSLGIPLDLAHMSVESFWEGLESEVPDVCCTHTAPRELLGVDRLPDASQVKALAERGGIVGIGLGNMFVEPNWWGRGDSKPEPVPLRAVASALEIWATSGGWDHVGIGSDLDGGIGVDESPEGLDSAADLPKLADELPADAAAGVMGGNWLDFFRKALPD